MTKGDDEGWWRRVETKDGDWGKWWLREAVTKGSGDEGKWWRREVVTKGSGDEGKCLDLFRVNRFSLGVLQRRNANRIVIVAWMCTWCCKTHCNSCINVEWDLCYWGGSRSTKPCVFPGRWRVPCVCVRRFGSFRGPSVPPWCSATCGCSCVRSSMRLLNLWLQIAV